MVFNLLSLFTMNKKHLLLFVFSYISFVCNTHAESYAHDTLVNVLRNEVQFYFDKLKNKETPAYFISLRVVDNKRLFLSSDFGLSSMDENHTRILTPQVRVGSPDLDNFAYLAQNRPNSRFPYERPSTSLPLDCNAIPVIKEVVWNGILERYETAVKTYQQMKASQKTNVTELDSVTTFAPAAVETYYERPYSEAETGIDKERFQEYINDASRLFKDYELTSGKVFLDYSLQRTTIVNTEGTVIAQNRKAYRLILEAVAEADTIVFDKTGTLTKAQPTVAGVVSFNGTSENELLRIAACLEEHFPHSIAKAVVDAAKRKNLDHEEMHSEVKYIVAHGISTTIGDSKAIIGSYHFVFEDEKCTIPEGMEEVFENLPAEYSHLYLAIDNELAAAILIEDPLREESADIVERLKSVGISKVVMMTGDCERTAKAIAEHVGVDEYYSEVLPEDKAAFVDREKAAGRKVIMIGDGINDSPALSAADAGIAISDGAEIAREVADITIDADSLDEIVTLKILANLLMKRIHRNYRFIVGFNTGLIVLGVAGVIAPTTSALLHNTSTLMIGLNSMKDMLPEL